MCSVGDMNDIEVDRLVPEEYRCNECNNTFKGIGKHVMCPSCQSEDVVLD